MSSFSGYLYIRYFSEKHDWAPYMFHFADQLHGFFILFIYFFFFNLKANKQKTGPTIAVKTMSKKRKEMGHNKRSGWGQCVCVCLSVCVWGGGGRGGRGVT